jgi:Leucine-rich repeat (LRR) protein
MEDSDVLRALRERVGRPFSSVTESGRCTELSLSDDNFIFHGLIRHHAPGAKLEILQLISRLTGLRKLNLRRNRLGVLPPEFCRLTMLEDLNLGSNYLGGVPAQIRNFKRLKSLYFGNNDLFELPSWLEELSELEHLAIHKNLKLKSVDPIRKLTRLRTLNLYYINFLELPEFVYDFHNLSTLTLWNVRRFPDGLETLRSLEFFTNCGGPSVRSLPKGFTRLRKLRMARLAKNSLETLPEDLGNLENLEQFSVYQNRLARLPDSAARLKRLVKLNLAWNCFEHLPDWLNDLKELRWLGVFGNPLRGIDPVTSRERLRIEQEWPFSTLPQTRGTMPAQ